MSHYSISLFSYKSARISYVVNGCYAGAEGSGDYSCYRAAWTDGSVESVVNSSSTEIAIVSGTVGNIKDSCHDAHSCERIAFSFGYAETVGDITNSCHGQYSCYYMISGNLGGSGGSVGDITCSCQGDYSCFYLYSGYGRDGGNALSIDELSYCCNGLDPFYNPKCRDKGPSLSFPLITLPETCAAGDYSDAGDSSCGAPTSSPSLSPSRSPSKVPSNSPSKVPSQSPSPTTAAFQDFIARCESTSGLTGSDAYVDCVGGFVRDTSQTCADACGNDASGSGGDCCTLPFACDSFTGKGEQD